MNELRKMFLEPSKSKGHLAVKSLSLASHNDNSLLLINSSMAPLKSYFTGREIPPRKRATTCQRRVHTDDIESIGKMARHSTFLEVLGSFSSGDYFKAEAIQWSWESLTEVVGLDPDRLYPSIYLDDNEVFKIWNKVIGIPARRIFRFGKEDNFWEHGVGPCGPCSETYYDRDEKYGRGKPGCTVDYECDRYMETWNNVPTQFESGEKGNYMGLSQGNTSTGMDLEHLAVVMQEVDSLSTVDTNKAMMSAVYELAHTTYQSDEKRDVSLRIIADRVKSCTFMVPGGIVPSNEGRGYVLHRLLRRAVRHRRVLGIEGKFMEKPSRVVIEFSKDGYPELEEKQAMTLRVISEEGDRFNKTINQGMAILSELEEKMSADGRTVLSGEDTFELYGTYRFPLGLAIEILEEKNFTVDEEGSKVCMKEQREKAHTARKTTNCIGADVTVYQLIDPSITTTFVGYDRLMHDSRITVLTTETDLIQALTDGESGMIIMEETPFYGTMDGQQVDTGVIVNGNGEFQVEDTIHLQDGKVDHVGRMVKGMFRVGDTVTLKVYEENRLSTGKNHSTTHLLQKALRLVLGEHVEQAGSYVDKGRLRSDFTHFSAVTPEEVARVEELVNRGAKESLPVVTQETSLDEAKRSGAMTLFDEKCGEKVRVVKTGDFSTELCGGTHAANIGAIGTFKVLSETDIAAGVRRIEALIGDGLMAYYQNAETELHGAVKAAKTIPVELKNKIESMLEEIHALYSENEKLKSKLVDNFMGDAMNQIMEAKGVKVLAVKVADVDMNGPRSLGDQLKEKLGESVVVVTSVLDGRANLMAAATEEAQKKGAHADNLIKVTVGLVGGGGGGRPNMVQAGGKNPAGVEDTLAKVRGVINEQMR